MTTATTAYHRGGHAGFPCSAWSPTVDGKNELAMLLRGLWTRADGLRGSVGRSLGIGAPEEVSMGALYLVKDGDRTVVLAAERDGKLYGYVPNVEAFVYNKPLSVDFLIDQSMTYEPQTAEQAAAIIKAGIVGKINGRTNKFLVDHMKAETNRMTPAEVFGANTSNATPDSDDI